MGIALRRRAVASYMRRLQYLRRCQQLSIENAAALHIVGPHLRILSYHGPTGSYSGPEVSLEGVTVDQPSQKTVRKTDFFPKREKGILGAAHKPL